MNRRHFLALAAATPLLKLPRRFITHQEMWSRRINGDRTKMAYHYDIRCWEIIGPPERSHA